VAVTYVRDGTARRVRARRCVLACYHSIIPRLCPELPDRQREALAEGVKVPLVYANVLIRDWTAFEKLRVSQIYAPNALFQARFPSTFPVALGSYRNPRTPAEPMVRDASSGPLQAGAPEAFAEQDRPLRVGHDDLSRTFERAIAISLAGPWRLVGSTRRVTSKQSPSSLAARIRRRGRPADRPRVGRTDQDKPWVIARRRFGRIAIGQLRRRAAGLHRRGHRPKQTVRSASCSS